MMDRIKDMATGFNPAEVQQYFEGIEFPVSKDNLLSVAEQKGAPSELIDKIRGANIGEFNGIGDVISAVKGS